MSAQTTDPIATESIDFAQLSPAELADDGGRLLDALLLTTADVGHAVAEAVRQGYAVMPAGGTPNLASGPAEISTLPSSPPKLGRLSSRASATRGPNLPTSRRKALIREK